MRVPLDQVSEGEERPPRHARTHRWLESKRGGCDFDRDAVSEREACCVHRCRVVQVLCLRVSKSVQKHECAVA